jgi:hypothetical protein
MEVFKFYSFFAKFYFLYNIIQEHNNTGSWYTLLMSKGELTLCAQTNIIQEHNNTSSCYTLFIYFVAQSAIFFPEFNIRLYVKNSESDFFCFLHRNQNIFFSNIVKLIGSIFYYLYLQYILMRKDIVITK